METIEDRRANGRDIYKRMFNEKKLAELERSISENNFGSAVSTLAQEFAFGSVWSRQGLEPKFRSFVTISVLIALRCEEELEKHLQVGLNFGITQKEIEEIIVQTIPYAGFPAAAQALKTAKKVFSEINAE